MNDELRRKAVVRKVTYFGIILALFTVSMFWRGVFRLPVGDPDQVAVRDEQGKPVDLSAGDRVARLPIRYQAEDLELLERDLGDPEVAGSLAQVSLIGFRGLVVTWLWNDTINNQKRGEYHEMERNARLLTKVQPHFIAPWIFQAWNITYNVSVETDKLGDQYYYIARGISLLAEGDRANTRPHRRGKEVYTVGSPDIRYQLGFFAQNKFSVSDKVNTLYSLSQLSLLPPAERNHLTYRVNQQANGPVDPDKFEAFCKNNPQLVRRLKTHLNLKKPEQVMEFLESNWRIPAQYDVETGQRQSDDKAFPVLPVMPPEGEGPDPQLAAYLNELRSQELLGTAAGRDAIDIRMFARAWFEHAQTVVPPPREGVPSMSPGKGEYDPFRYRIPERPALIIFRMSPPRAQTYVAERLQKEGWFEKEGSPDATVWDPESGFDKDAKWFPPARPGQPAREVRLRAGTGSRAEWEKTFRLWEEFGRKNGLTDEARNRQQEMALATVRAGLPQLGVPLTREYSDAELATLGLRREQLNARNAIIYFDQNRQVTNYQYFLEVSLAEMEPDVARARQAFWIADELHARNDERELGERVRASAMWRRAFSQKHGPFYNSPRSESLHEITLAQELAIAALLAKPPADPDTAKRVKGLVGGLGMVAPTAVALTEPNISRVAAQEEAQVRIALAFIEIDPTHPLAERAMEDVKRFKRDFPNATEVPTVQATARGLLDAEFAWMKLNTRAVRPGERPEEVPVWVWPTVRFAQLYKDGLIGAPDPSAGGLPPGVQPGQGGLPAISPPNPATSTGR